MSVRFAAPVFAFGAKMNRATIYGVTRKAINDNPTSDLSDNVDTGAPQSQALDAALRHFAEHGLAAALNARKHAEKALAAGDDATCDKWLEICRALDRRMARDFDVRNAASKRGAA